MKVRRFLIAIVALACMSGAGAASTSLSELQEMKRGSAESKVESANERGGIRLEALREAALGLGARGGLAYQAGIQNRALEIVARDLDTIYDFSTLMIAGRVIPAVMSKVVDLYKQDGANIVRLSGTQYRIEAQARFSSRPPIWREYLIQEFGPVTPPNSALLPRTLEEQDIWRRLVAEGWEQGVEQAKIMLTTNQARLNRDFTGMVLYHRLALDNVVTMPVVASSHMPVTGSGDVLGLDETLLRITEVPKFQRDAKKWQALTLEEDVMTRAPGSR